MEEGWNIPDPPPDPRFTYDTKFQRILCSMGLFWKTAVITDWISRGAVIKDVAKWMNLQPDTISKHLVKAYVRFGLRGKGSALLLVGIRKRLEELDRIKSDGRS